MPVHADSKVLGHGKLSMAPSIVALVQFSHWTIGALTNNAWSVAGSGGRTSVNQMNLQYFINYNLKNGWSLSSSPMISANWKAASGNVWTASGWRGVGQVMRLGMQPVNITAQFYGNAKRPSGGSPWGYEAADGFPLSQEAARVSWSLITPKPIGSKEPVSL